MDGTNSSRPAKRFLALPAILVLPLLSACNSESQVLWVHIDGRPWKTVEAYPSKSAREQAGRTYIAQQAQRTSGDFASRASADGHSFAVWMGSTAPDNAVPSGAVWTYAKCWPTGVNPR